MWRTKAKKKGWFAMKQQMKRKNRKKTRIVLTIWIVALIFVIAISNINRQDVVAYCKNPAYGIRQMEEIDASDVETSRDRIIDAAREVVKRSASNYGGNVGGVERPTNFVLQNTVYYKWYGYQDDVTNHQFDLSCVNQTTHIIYQSTATKRRVDIDWVAGEWSNGGWTVGRWQDVSHQDLLSNSYSYYVTNGVVFQQLAVDRFWEEIRQYPKLYDVRRYEVLRQQNFDKSQVRMGDVLFTGYQQADGNINRMHCMFVIGKLSAEEKEGFVFDEACPWHEDKMFMASTGPEKNGRLVYTDLLDTPFAGDPGKGYYVYAVARPLFMPQPLYGGFMIKKIGSDGAALAGAEFDLIDEDGVTCLHIAVPQAGYTSEMNLFPGNYTLVETKSPEGCVPDSTPYPLTITENATNRVYWDNPITNERITGYIKIVKTDEKGAPIAGATFDILKSSAVIETLTTNDSGEASTRGLPLGTYAVQETYVPLPYQLKEDIYTVPITEHGKTEILNVQNEKIKVSLSVIKKEAITGGPLPGAHLQVIHEATGDLIDEWISSDITHLLRDLILGETYILREIKAPEGYVLAEDILFTVEGTEKSQNVTMYNDRTRVKILKQDAETNTPLSGVEFALFRAVDGEAEAPLSFRLIDGVYVYDPEGNITSLITNDDGQIVIEKIPVGDYYCQETKSPEGYVPDSTLHPLAIVENATNRVYWDNPITNERITGYIKIIKTDEKGMPIAGATFDVLKGSTVIAILTTNDSGEATTSSLPFGVYTVEETYVPSPYQLKGDTYTVSITEHGKTEILNVQNEKIKVSLPVIKKDALTEEPLSGAHLQVIHEATGDLIDEWTSDNAPYLLRDLTVGETYILREIKAPEGYVLSDEIRFNVEGVKKEQNVSMYNDRIRANILKQDAETKNPLSGAEFSIYWTAYGKEQVPLSFTLSDGVYIYDIEGKITSLVTNEDGQITIEKIPAGNYHCQETTAPEGYIPDDTLHELIVEATSENVSLLIENEAFLLLPVVIKTGEKTPSTFIPHLLGFSALTSLGGVIILRRKGKRKHKR